MAEASQGGAFQIQRTTPKGGVEVGRVIGRGKERVEGHRTELPSGASGAGVLSLLLLLPLDIGTRGTRTEGKARNYHRRRFSNPSISTTDSVASILASRWAEAEEKREKEEEEEVERAPES